MAMRIVTINVPHSYLAAFQSLIDLGLYNSRSQLVRVCLKEFLEKEKDFIVDLKNDSIQLMKNIKNLTNGKGGN